MNEFVATNIFNSSLIIFLSAFVITYLLVPKIINVVNHKKLLDTPNNRSSHKQLTPTFGGISFFIILVFTLYVVRVFDVDNIRLNIVAALIILLFIGLKDDLVVISNTTKMLGQILAVSLLLFQTNIYHLNLHGFWGINLIDGVWGFVFTTFLMVSIINSFNLIDGIDGIAALIGTIILSFFAFIFYIIQQPFYLLICIAFIGSLIAFLRYNLSVEKKIFMGDTGSLILGFVVSIMTMIFLNLDLSNLEKLQIAPSNTLLVIIAILGFPLFDMARVFIYRIFNKKNPLKADRNHTHHILLSLGNSHIKSSFLISLGSLCFTIIFTFLASNIVNYWVASSIFIISFIIFYFVFFHFSKKHQIKN